MARHGLAEMADAVFEKDGRKIPYRTVRLTDEGLDVEEENLPHLMVKEAAAPGVRRRKGKKKTAVEGKNKASKRAPAKKRVAAESAPADAKAKESPRATKSRAPVLFDEPTKRRRDTDLEAALKAWRLEEAKRKGLPAFRIMTDKTLREIAERRP
jgi:DNA topoisomerase-3